MEGGTGASFPDTQTEISGASMLAYFDGDAHTTVIADAILVGLGVVLV